MYNNVIKTEFLGHILRHKNSLSPQRSSTMLSFLVKKKRPTSPHLQNDGFFHKEECYP